MFLLSLGNRQIPVYLQHPKFYHVRRKLSISYEDGTDRVFRNVGT